LVTDHTIDAIAEIGRASHESALSKFRMRMNAAQKDAVIAFLDWCGATLIANDGEQIARAAKRWRSAV